MPTFLDVCGCEAYVTKLAAEAGLKDPSDAELRRFDKTRKNKKVSYDD